jgi:microcystin-dependent protein
MAEVFIGSLMLVPYNFAPKGFAFCQGQILAIAPNSALFSLLGTTYGGNGITNFALPDLRGRITNSSGQAPGLQNYDLGQADGEENHTLVLSEMPAHNHQVFGSGLNATVSQANGNALANGSKIYNNANPPLNATLNPKAAGPAGGSQSHQNTMPTLTLNWIIAVQGIFPQRP